ncbi:hypothetical protein [Ahniella affigens]|nr:hypothetical protein [Ahniella affigens]
MTSRNTALQTPSSNTTIAVWLLLAAGVGVCVFGLMTVDLYAALPAYRFRDLLWLALGGLALALPLRFLLRLPWVIAWCLAMAGIHVAGLNLGPVLCVIALAAAALALGSRVLSRDADTSTATQVILGLAMLAALLGWLLPYPVHTRLCYIAMLAIPILWRRDALRDALASWRTSIRQAGDTLPSFSVTVLAFVLAMIATAAWLPVMMSDDVVYHLALPAQLIESGHYHFNVTDQVWAVSPWANDVLHAVVMMLSGQNEIGALNSLWLLLGASLFWRVAGRLDCSPAWAFLGSALFFSVPLFHMGTNSMQTELASTAVVLALLDHILAQPGNTPGRHIVVTAMLSSFLLALKISNVAILAPLLIWWLIRQRPFAIKPWLIGIAVGIAIGGSSYAYAWILTGNPVLPLFNSVFQSALMPPTNFTNPTYHGLLSWDVLYQMSFDSSRFMESEDGTFGFQWLGLSGLLLLALFDRRLRPLLCVGLAGVIILFVQMQYLRYLLPALAVLGVVLTVVLSRLRPEWLSKTLVVGLCVLNLYFQCQSAPPLRQGTVSEVLRQGLHHYRNSLLRTAAPERLLLDGWRTRLGPYATVFAGTNPNVAELAGRGHTLSWYAADYWARMPVMEADTSGQAYLEYFNELGVDHVLIRPEFASPALMAALAQRGEWLDSQGAAMLYRLRWPAADLQVAPDIVLPDQAGLIKRFPVDPAIPAVGAAEITLRCGKKGWGVAVNHVARGDFGERKLDSQVNFCGAGHELKFKTSALLPDGTKEWEVQVQTYTADNPLDILAAKAWLRPDSARRHDHAAELRLF